MKDAFLVVTTTVAGPDEANALARALVEARLAACVQMLPIASTFRWKGAVETAAEHLLLCKVRAADYAEVEAEIRARHAYDVPEIIALPVAEGSADYLGWLTEATAR